MLTNACNIALAICLKHDWAIKIEDSEKVERSYAAGAGWNEHKSTLDLRMARWFITRK